MMRLFRLSGEQRFLVMMFVLLLVPTLLMIVASHGALYSLYESREVDFRWFRGYVMPLPVTVVVVVGVWLLMLCLLLWMLKGDRKVVGV